MFEDPDLVDDGDLVRRSDRIKDMPSSLVSEKTPAAPACIETLEKHPLGPISASGSKFNPRNTPCIPAVKISAFLELEPK